MPLEEYDFDEAVESLSHVFGIAGICPIVVEEDKDFEKIAEVVEKYVDEDYADKHFSFKVHVRRADKKYPIPSMEAAARLGERLLEKFEDLSVDVHNPDVMLTVEIRDKVYIYSREIRRTGWNAGWYKRKSNASSFRWYRQPGGWLHDFQERV